MKLLNRTKTQFNIRGFFIVPNLLKKDNLAVLKNVLDCDRQSLRLGTNHSEIYHSAISEIIKSDVLRKLITELLGKEAGLIRTLFFNKTRETNWAVGWHQDRTIAVKQKIPVAGFTGWSIKENIPHVQAPASLLKNMLICRIHLDPADIDNGVLQVIPGSHQKGIERTNNLMQNASSTISVPCTVQAGDAVVMRPLLIHRSKKSTTLKPRRVIHLEYADCELPYPLQWWKKIGF